MSAEFFLIEFYSFLWEKWFIFKACHFMFNLLQTFNLIFYDKWHQQRYINSIYFLLFTKLEIIRLPQL